MQLQRSVDRPVHPSMVSGGSIKEQQHEMNISFAMVNHHHHHQQPPSSSSSSSMHAAAASFM
jgi:transcription factor TGA